MRMRLGTLCALLALVALALACGGDDSAPPPAGTPVVLARVELRDVEESIEATGQLLARDRAEIAAEVPGRITEILLFEGDDVDADEVVLEIDPERRKLEVEDARARVTEAEAALLDRQREVRRIRELRTKNVASQAQLDQAETQLKLARARLAAARAHLGVAERALRDASVSAPFEGIIARRFVSAGEYVKAGQELFELVALDPIEVEFHVTEKDSGRVELNDELEVRVAPYPDESFSAVVTLVSPTIDARTRTLRLKANLPNPEGRLRPGLFARVDLGVDQRADVPMVPEEAILYRADGAIVFRLVDGNRVERRIVQTGIHLDGVVEVVQGLDGGDFVVRRGHAALIDGALVAARNPDGSPATPQVAEGGTPTEEAD